MTVPDIIVALLFGLSIIDIIIVIAFDLTRDDFVNPVANYQTWTNMNWFGVALFTLILNILFPIVSVVYWFSKLCTVGRKS